MRKKEQKQKQKHKKVLLGALLAVFAGLTFGSLTSGTYLQGKLPVSSDLVVEKSPYERPANIAYFNQEDVYLGEVRLTALKSDFELTNVNVAFLKKNNILDLGKLSLRNRDGDVLSEDYSYQVKTNRITFKNIGYVLNQGESVDLQIYSKKITEKPGNDAFTSGERVRLRVMQMRATDLNSGQVVNPTFKSAFSSNPVEFYTTKLVFSTVETPPESNLGANSQIASFQLKSEEDTLEVREISFLLKCERVKQPDEPCFLNSKAPVLLKEGGQVLAENDLEFIDQKEAVLSYYLGGSTMEVDERDTVYTLSTDLNSLIESNYFDPVKLVVSVPSLGYINAPGNIKWFDENQHEVNWLGDVKSRYIQLFFNIYQ